MRGVYRVLALAIPVLVALQAAFIGLNTFGLFKWVDDGNSLTQSAMEGDWEWDGAIGAMLHGMVGMMLIPLIALVLLIVSFFAKIPGGAKWAAFVLLVVVVQVALAFVAFGIPAVGALHGLNAFVLFGVAMAAAQKAKESAVTARTDAGEHVRV